MWAIIILTLGCTCGYTLITKSIKKKLTEATIKYFSGRQANFTLYIFFPTWNFRELFQCEIIFPLEEAITFRILISKNISIFLSIEKWFWLKWVLICLCTMVVNNV